MRLQRKVGSRVVSVFGPVGFKNSPSALTPPHAYSWMSPPSRSRASNRAPSYRAKGHRLRRSVGRSQVERSVQALAVGVVDLLA